MTTKNSLAYLPSVAAQLPSAESTRLVRITVSGGDRYVISFSPSTEQELIWLIPDFPSAWQGGTLSLDVFCCMQSATSGSINLLASVESIAGGSGTNLTTTTTFDTANLQANITVPSGAGQLFVGTVTLTHNGSIAIGDMVRIKVQRDTSNATASGNLYVLGALVYESVSICDLTPFDGVTFKNAVSTKTGNYTVTSSDGVILADSTSGNLTITLPSAVSVPGQSFQIKQISASNAVTIATSAGQTIDGNSTLVLNAWASVTLCSNGSNWFIL